MRAFGKKHLQFRAHGFNGHHAVVQEEDLAAAIEFALDGVANHALVVLRDDGLDGQAVVRRRLDGAHVARAGEREVKRAGNGRGAQGQHVHQRAQALEFLLVQNAEALLLVNHHQPQILESDVVLQNPVRADDDVHAAGGEILNGALLLAAGAKTRKQFQANRIIRHAFAEVIVMLLRQHRRGHQHRHLFALHHGFEGGADGDFRFAKAHVAANQAVHRPGLFHVRLRFGNGGDLVGRFLVDEGVFKFVLPGCVSGLKAWPACVSRAAWMRNNSAATSRTARSACSFALRQRVPLRVFSGGRVLPAPTYLPTRCASLTGT